MPNTRGRYNEDRTMKLCNGVLHDGPTFLPVSAFAIAGRGSKNQPILRSLCKACHSASATKVGTGRGLGEPEIVDGAVLSKYLRQWVVEWLADRPVQGTAGEGFGTGKITYYGPINYLSTHSGIHIRRVQGIVNGEFQRVPLSQADEVLCAADLYDLLGREIPVLKNPLWSNEDWQEYMRQRGVCI